MKLALIPPVSLLEYTDKTYCQLMLPQLMENDQYNYVYRSHCRDNAQFVILDNGANEEEDYGVDDLIAMASIYGVDELVIPDVIGDAAATRAKAMRTFKKFPFPARFKYMYVLQGQSYEEFQAEAKWALAQMEISTIAIPRHSIKTCDNKHVRQMLANDMYGWAPDRPVHLLGGSPIFPNELEMVSFPENVRSHDTSSPFGYAYYDAQLRSGGSLARPNDYFNLTGHKFNMAAVDMNVEDLIEWTGSENV